eukprot:gene19657-26343_t
MASPTIKKKHRALRSIGHAEVVGDTQVRGKHDKNLRNGDLIFVRDLRWYARVTRVDDATGFFEAAVTQKLAGFDDRFDTFACFDDPQVMNKSVCEMRGHTWDRMCKYDGECPFFGANKTLRGGCESGHCEMPIGVTQVIPNPDYVNAYGSSVFAEPDTFFEAVLKNPNTLEPVYENYTDQPAPLSGCRQNEIVEYIQSRLQGYVVSACANVGFWKSKRDTRKYCIFDTNVYKSGKLHGKQLRLWVDVSRKQILVDKVDVVGTFTEDNIRFQTMQRGDSFTFVDICCGIGAFHIALSDLGGRCVLACDRDSKSKRVYMDNHGDNFEWHDDLKTLKTLPPHDTKPNVVMLENVLGLLNIHDGRTVKYIQRKLRELGYTVNISTYDAVDFGSPVHRSRVIIVGMLGFDGDIAPVVPQTKLKLPDILETARPTSYIDPAKYVILPKDKWYESNDKLFVGYLKAKTYKNSVCETMTSTHRYAVYLPGNKKVRFLTPREMTSCMGFPDTFRISPVPSVASRQITNSINLFMLRPVCAGVIRALRRHRD